MEILKERPRSVNAAIIYHHDLMWHVSESQLEV
jgi:hypothetical protein